MGDGVAVVDQQGIIGDGAFAVWGVPVVTIAEQIVGTASCPGHGLVNTEFHGIGGIIIIQACGIAAGIVNAQDILTSAGEGGIGQASELARSPPRSRLEWRRVARQVGSVGG